MQFSGSLILVVLTLILSALPDHTYANSTNDPGPTPESSAIDTSTMKVGTQVVIVYGLGIADPGTGEWPKLATATGTIQAINEQRLLLGQKGHVLPQRIELHRIQRLELPDLHAAQPLHGGDVSAPEDTTELTEWSITTFPRYRAEKEESWMAGAKLTAGMIGGLALGWVGVRVGEALDSGDGFGGSLIGLASGYTMGTAYGVSMIDPRGPFLPALAGSTAGFLLGGYLSDASDTRWGVILGPPILSTVASELSRKPHDAKRLSLGFQPTRSGGFSCVATLHL